MGKRIKKPELNELERLIYASYKQFQSQPVYCSLCGEEIIWRPNESNYEQTYGEHQEEILVKMHKDCFYGRKPK